MINSWKRSRLNGTRSMCGKPPIDPLVARRGVSIYQSTRNAGGRTWQAFVLLSDARPWSSSGLVGPAVNLGAFKWFSPVEDGGADVEPDPGGSSSQAGSGRGPDGPLRPGLFRLRPGLRGLSRRLSGRRHGRAVAPVHPSQPGLRRHLLRHRLRRLPIHEDGRDRLAAAADRLRRSLPPLRRRVPATRHTPRATSTAWPAPGVAKPAPRPVAMSIPRRPIDVQPVVEVPTDAVSPTI